MTTPNKQHRVEAEKPKPFDFYQQENSVCAELQAKEHRCLDGKVLNRQSLDPTWIDCPICHPPKEPGKCPNLECENGKVWSFGGALFTPGFHQCPQCLGTGKAVEKEGA